MNLIESTREECETKAAQVIADKLTQLASEKPHVVFGIPGGRNVAGIFSKLLSHNSIPWKKVHIFMEEA